MEKPNRPNKPNHKFLKHLMFASLFAKDLIYKAKARLFLGEHKTTSKSTKQLDSSRGDYYCRPLVKYLKPQSRNDTTARVCRNLALVLVRSGEAIILKG